MVTQTSPPPNEPRNTAITVSGSFGSIAMPAPASGECGGVRSSQVTPPSIERITLTGWKPEASVMPAQTVCGFDGSIAMSNTSSLSASMPVRTWCVQFAPAFVLVQTLSCVAA
jgi:hypothetical protein